MLTATETGHIESFKPKRFAQRYGVDPLLTLFILITALYGLIILYSASGQSLSMVLRQGAHVIVGTWSHGVLSQVRRDVIIQVTPFIFLFAALLLVTQSCSSGMGRKVLSVGLIYLGYHDSSQQN